MPRRSEPIIHFASREDASERIEMGPALCKAGYASRTDQEQYVTGIFDHVDCKNCIRLVRREVAAETADV